MDIFESINDWLVEVIFPFDEFASIILRLGIHIWNNATVLLLRLLGMDMDTFAGGTGMRFIEYVYPFFLSVAVPLFVCFFLYNLYCESFEERKFGDFWTIFRMFVPLVIGEVLLANSMPIIRTVFRMGVGMVQSIVGTDIHYLIIDEAAMTYYINSYEQELGANVLGGLLMLAASILTTMILIICAGILIYTVYFRFLKLYVMLPFAPLALSTYIAPHEIKRISFQYGKYIIVLALENVAMLIMLILCNVVLSAGIPELLSLLDSETNLFIVMIVHLLVIIFNVTLTVGTVKGTETMLERWLMH